MLKPSKENTGGKWQTHKFDSCINLKDKTNNDERKSLILYCKYTKWPVGPSMLEDINLRRTRTLIRS